jgi:MoxR-like ATPase
MATQPEAAGSARAGEKFIRYGSSPRGAQALVECGRVLALLRGRLHLSWRTSKAVAPAVLRHRIILNFDAHADGRRRKRSSPASSRRGRGGGGPRSPEQRGQRSL